MNNQGTISTGLNRFYAKVYGYLGGGLALSAIILISHYKYILNKFSRSSINSH